MNQAQSDKTEELEQILEKHFDFWVIGCTKEHFKQSIIEAIAALTARENRIRIEENQRISRIWTDTGIHAPQQIENRIEQLTHRSHNGL